ncbi:hypothetical protein [Amorphus orientalis]|uniref:Type IV secretory pathway TrbD component n=1 Tax=Amorphus orientalis TaxID=649198 RepID=A0AAE3VMD7_9HYPH|nr:hypothetical protein [Amorphus orientalis]MDQ0314615.1 type IV secretory pathway TrbD component [Amorphus orientalis]
MAVKKGKHTKVEGPFKSFVMVCGVVGLLLAFGAFANGTAGFGIVVLLVAIAVLFLGSKIPDRNRVEW